MHTKRLFLAWAASVAASQSTADHPTSQQTLLDHNTPSSSWTHDLKTSRAKTLLKIASNGQANAIPEIAKLAIDISATSNISQTDAIERLGVSISQVEQLLSDQKAKSVLETYAGASTRVLNDKDEPAYYWNGAKRPAENSSIEVTNYKAETFFTARSSDGVDIEDIRSMMRSLREMSHVKTQNIEWKLSDSSRDRTRVEAKRKALQKCFSQVKETADILGYDAEAVELMELEEMNVYVQERQASKTRVYYWPSRGDEIDARPSEMEMDARMSCTFGVMSWRWTAYIP